MTGLFPLPRANARGYYADRAWLDEVARLRDPIEGEMTMHPGPARDVDFDGWLDRIAHHPPRNQRTVLAHTAARQAIAEVGRILHGLLPAGQDKSLVFTHLKDAAMYANSAIAVSDGPHEWMDTETLERLAHHGPLDTSDVKTVAETASDTLAKLGQVSPIDSAGRVDGGDDPHPPTETYREEVRGPAGETVFQVAGSLFRAGGYVDLAVICTDREVVDQAIQDARFNGFHRTLDTAEDVQHAVNAILAAAQRAGLGHVESPIA